MCSTILSFSLSFSLAVQSVRCVLKHSDGSTDKVQLNHTMNDAQITWFQAGSALNKMAKMFSK